MSDYDTDFVQWSREQADLLRRMAAGGRVNDRVDWGNVAEAAESLGKSDQRDLSSCVQTILRHLIKLMISPASDRREAWSSSAVRSDDCSRTARARVKWCPLDLAEFGDQPLAEPQTLTEDQILGPWLPD